MSSKVYIDDCAHGKGVFTSVKLHPGDVAFYVNGPVVNYSSLKQLGDQTASNVVQIGAVDYINPGFPAVYLNHSCSPNCGLRDDVAVIALTEIEPGEELRFDYSTCIHEDTWSMACSCGTPDCRRHIGDFDDLPDELKGKYLELGIVQSFITKSRNRRA